MGGLQRFVPVFLALFAGAAGAQDLPTREPTKQAQVERWRGMSPEDRVVLQRRFAALSKMSKADRVELRKRSRKLKAERERLERELDRSARERLKGMQPAERNRILREHQKDEHRRMGEVLREDLDSERIDWVDRLVGLDRPRPLQDVRSELYGKVEERLTKRWMSSGDLGKAERVLLKDLTGRARMEELLRIRRKHIELAIEEEGLPVGVKPEQWQRLLGVESPERFLSMARKMGVGGPVRPDGRFAKGDTHGVSLFQNGLRELAEMLRPTMDDRLETAGMAKPERRKFVNQRIAKRIRGRLADASWLPGLDRSGLEGIENGLLLKHLRGFLSNERAGRAKDKRQGVRARGDHNLGRQRRGRSPGGRR